jgi:hypothetical protein
VTTEPVVIEITLPAPVEAVWEAFREPAVIRRWFGWDYEGLEDEIKMIFVDGTVASEAERTLHIGGHLFALGAQGSQTTVRVTRSAPVDPDDGMDWDAYYDDVDEGWISFLQQLRFVLARHPGDTRRTVYLNGEALGTEPTAAAELLGLGHVGSSGPYSATTAVGDVLTGEVWFRSERQLGLTVDDWGDGLLLLTQSPSVRPPHGAAAVFLCTYGLDPGAATELEERWSRWWAAHYKTDN